MKFSLLLLLNGIKNFLELINDNWTLIVIVVGLCIYTYKRIYSYLKLSEEKKVRLAWDCVKESILSWVSDAEEYWTNQKQLDGAGSIKRSEVISKVFETYPILNKFANKDYVIEKIDKMIDDALAELKTIVENQVEEIEFKNNQQIERTDDDE